jgi:hypothetical protein
MFTEPAVSVLIERKTACGAVISWDPGDFELQSVQALEMGLK